MPAPVAPTTLSSSRLFIVVLSLGTSCTVPGRFLAGDEQGLGSFALRNARNESLAGRLD
jgi:hypothetical protein